MITLADQIKCAGRELGLRKNVYPKFLKSGRITQEQAAHEIAAMEHVHATLKAHSELREGIRRRLDHMMGAHSDSAPWYANQISQTLRWLDEFERRQGAKE